jgi:hypothetical protein
MQVNGGPPGLTRTSTRSLMAGNLHGGGGQRLTFPWGNEGDEFNNSLKEEWTSIKSFWNKTRDGGEWGVLSRHCEFVGKNCSCSLCSLLLSE